MSYEKKPKGAEQAYGGKDSERERLRDGVTESSISKLP